MKKNSTDHFSSPHVVPEEVRLLLQQALEGRLHDVDAVEGQSPAGRDSGAVGGTRVLLLVQLTPLTKELPHVVGL